MRAALVACGGAKRASGRPARELYTSDLFKLSLEWAERHADHGAVWIISQHGLLHPQQWVKPYYWDNKSAPAIHYEGLDTCLRQRGRATRVVHVVGGRNSIDVVSALVNWYGPSRSFVPQIIAPLDSMGLPARMGWLRRQLDRPVLDVAVDLEPTGVNPLKHGICEVGLAWRDPPTGQLVTWSRDAHPGELALEAAEPEAFAVNGFTPDRILRAQRLAVVIESANCVLKQLADTHDIRLHALDFDSSFDCGFLNGALKAPWGPYLMADAYDAPTKVSLVAAIRLVVDGTLPLAQLAALLEDHHSAGANAALGLLLFEQKRAKAAASPPEVVA